MHHRIAIAALALACSLAACGASAPSAAAPTVQKPSATPVVITQIVRQTVIVTATPLPTAAPLPTPTPLPKFGKWDVFTDTSSFDDSARVVLSLDAEDTIDTGFGQLARPTLVLRCQEGETEAYINTETQPDVETGNLDGATARVRFDQEKAESLNMGKSTDSKALFFPDAGIITRMAEHQQLLFSFTPFQQSPTEMTFDLRGLPDVLPQLRAACKK